MVTRLHLYSSFKIAFFLLLITFCYLEAYGINPNAVEYKALYLMLDLTENDHKYKEIFFDQNLISIQEIVSKQLEHQLDSSSDSESVDIEDYDEQNGENRYDFEWEYDDIIWDLGSLKKKLAFFAKNPKESYASVKTTSKTLRIKKLFMISTIVNIQFASYADYFQIEYRKDDESKVMHLLCAIKGYEYTNSYYIKLAGEDSLPEKEDAKNEVNCLKLEKVENHEVNLMKMVVDLVKKNRFPEKKELPDGSESSGYEGILKGSLVFKFNSYTGRRNEEETSDQFFYTLSFHENHAIICSEYEYDTRSIKKNDQFHAVLSPIVSLADYEIFVMEKEKFYSMDSFKKMNKGYWAHSLMDDEKIKEMIFYHNGNIASNKYHEQDIELKRALGEDYSIHIPRFGTTSVRSLKIKKSFFRSFRFQYEMVNFVREENEDVRVHYFTFYDTPNSVKLMAVPANFLRGANKLQFEKQDNFTTDWNASSEVVNEQYTLMLIDSLVSRKRKGKSVSKKYKLREGDNTHIRFDVNMSSIKIYQSFLSGIRRKKQNIRLKLEAIEGEERESNRYVRSDNSYYITGGTGIIAILIGTIYGFRAKPKKDHKKKRKLF